ncbi:hypothetical protein SEVIR_2G267000v4 [Setaria viridis]|uniref:NAD-dependent epimerase/dehydratase domain-containing protein n=1 Tax=Setaria viridis TaxID=4556 RepID=A0A4U6VV85_SETVI|nr:cinnamoyl-CoA reductase 2-like [Setaria viridis]TKW33861.1 hypothetical protein SEVIR_2G267000v2 [Setaria viridis]
MASPSASRRVTGGGSYIASWLVKLLLTWGYAVNATVRDPGDPKNAHLGRLDGAAGNLRLFKADMLDPDALATAVAGCEGVFHVASPVPSVKAVDPESEVLAPAVKGTLNILQACSANNVQKVVVVSSTSADHFNPNWPQGKPKDESCWSDRDLCLKNKKAESSGRYLCAPDRVSTKDLLNILKKTHPNYNCINCDNDSDLKSIITPITSEKLKNLGWKPRTIEERLSDSIEYYEKAGLLQDVEGCPCRLPHPFHLDIDK